MSERPVRVFVIESASLTRLNVWLLLVVGPLIVDTSIPVRLLLTIPLLTVPVIINPIVVPGAAVASSKLFISLRLIGVPTGVFIDVDSGLPPPPLLHPEVSTIKER